MACRNLANKPFQIFSRNGSKLVKIGSVAMETQVRKKSTQKRTDLTKVTHTGQIWAKDDYRNVRFTNAKRYVNGNWSTNLAVHLPPIITAERITSCDGGGALGHPKVYICMDKPSPHYCFYCGQEFRSPKLKK